MKYQFDFSNLKLRDLRAIFKADMGLVDLIDWLDKVTVGGVDDFPIERLREVSEQAAAAWNQHMAEIARPQDLDSLRDLLKDVNIDARRTHTVDRRGAKPQ